MLCYLNLFKTIWIMDIRIKILNDDVIINSIEYNNIEVDITNDIISLINECNFEYFIYDKFQFNVIADDKIKLLNLLNYINSTAINNISI
jgi:hypothetical protein